MRKLWILMLVILPMTVFAQFKTQAKPVKFVDRLQYGRTDGLPNLGLDMSRFSMTHSYSMNYMSVGGKSLTQGLYLNTMSYQFSIPLTVSLQLGMAHNPFQSANTASILQNGPFISGAQIRYQPSEKTVLEVNFRQMPYQNFSGLYNMHYPGYGWYQE